MYRRTLILITTVLVVHVQTVAAQRTCFAGTVRDGEECTICPLGTYSDDFNLLECKLCPAGTFRAMEGAKSEEQCLPCPAGTFAKDEGLKKCTPCPPGEDSLPGSQACGFCPPGSALSRFSGCGACIRAFFTDKPGSKFCKRCPDGTFTGGGSDPFPTRGFGAKSCTPCPPGTFRRNSEFDFNPVSVFLSNKCEKCQAGTYSDEAGAISCKICPPGTFSSSKATRCTPCPKGTFSKTIPATRCRRCPSGSSTAGTGAAACKDPDKGCAFNTFENKDGNCQACMPGERYDSRRKKCVRCGRNEVSNGGVDTECRLCPGGKVPVGDLSFLENSECECPFGFVDEGGQGCVPCPPGSFWENDNNFFLTNDNFKRTGPERFDRAVRGICSPCPVGSFSDKAGSIFCKNCPRNTFQDIEGSAECMKCPPGSRSRNPGSANCIVEESGCEPGQARNRDGKCEAASCPSKNSFLSKKTCLQCQAGFRAAGKRGCVRCGKKTTSIGGATEKCTRCPKTKIGARITGGRGCECDFRKVDLNGKCVKRCPAGTGPDFVGSTTLLGEEPETCLKCPPRTVSNVQTDFSCDDCKSNTIAQNGIKCVPCPKGQVVERDIFGRLLDRCRSP